MLRRVIGVALMVDGLAAALWASTLLTSLSSRDAASLTAIGARMAAAALAVFAGWLVTQHRPAAPWLAAVAATATGAVVAIGLVTRALPSNLDPAMRDVAAGVYLVCAGAIVWWARRTMPDGARRD